MWQNNSRIKPRGGWSIMDTLFAFWAGNEGKPAANAPEVGVEPQTYSLLRRISNQPLYCDTHKQNPLQPAAFREEPTPCENLAPPPNKCWTFWMWAEPKYTEGRGQAWEWVESVKGVNHPDKEKFDANLENMLLYIQTF